MRRTIEQFTRLAFALASLFLMLLSGGLIVYAIFNIVGALTDASVAIGPVLLEAIGYAIIAIVVFDVGKYLLEEEAIRGREMREASEARRSLTKFMSTITIAVFLEALVGVFEAGKDDMRLMLYPTLLLFAGVAMIVGLGVYQRLSATVEVEIKEEGETKPKSRKR